MNNVSKDNTNNIMIYNCMLCWNDFDNKIIIVNKISICNKFIINIDLFKSLKKKNL